MTDSTTGPGAPSGPLNIIHCFRAAAGGVFRHVQDLAMAQTERGHRVGIVCDSTTGGAWAERLLDRIEPRLALGLKRLPMRRQIAPSDLRAALALYRQVRSLNPDVMHGHGAKGGAYARMIGTFLRASGLRVARIYTPHGGSLHYDRASLKGGAYLRLERQLERFSDGLVFVSAYERDAYATKVGQPSKPFAVVHNGLFDDEFEPVEPGPSATDVLFVGTFRDLKGPDVLIEALALIRDATGRAPTATMVGDGDLEATRAQAAQFGLGDAVTFREPMPVREAFALGRVLAVPSRAESLPYVILEAAAAGVAIVATNVGGISEIIPADRLVPPGDAQALADALAAKLTAPDAAKAEAAGLRATIRQDFNALAMAEAIENLYRRAGAGHAR